MTTGKGRIKIEQVLLIFQENVPIMGIPMPNHGHSLTRRVEYKPGSFDQLAQRRPVFLPTNGPSMAIVDSPTIFEQFLKGYIYTWNTLWNVLTTGQRNTFSFIKAFEAPPCQAMPEKLVYGSMSVLLGCTMSKRLIVDSKQTFTCLLFSRYHHRKSAIFGVACLNRTNEVKHDGPAHNWIDDHLPSPLMHRL